MLQRAMIRTGGVEDAGAASHFSTGEVVQMHHVVAVLAGLINGCQEVSFASGV